MTDTKTLPPMVPVTSTNMESVGRDGNHTLIRFKSGGLYRYHDVPQEAHDAMLGAPSKGKHFKEHWAGKFRHTKVQ